MLYYYVINSLVSMSLPHFSSLMQHFRQQRGSTSLFLSAERLLSRLSFVPLSSVGGVGGVSTRDDLLPVNCPAIDVTVHGADPCVYSVCVLLCAALRPSRVGVLDCCYSKVLQLFCVL